MTLKSIPWWLWLIPIAVLLVATARMPYGYYTFTRIVVCGFGIIIAWVSWRDKRPVYRAGAIAFALIAILFNPVISIHLHRNTWFVLDIAVAVLTAAHLVLVRLKHERSQSLPTKPKLKDPTEAELSAFQDALHHIDVKEQVAAKTSEFQQSSKPARPEPFAQRYYIPGPKQEKEFVEFAISRPRAAQAGSTIIVHAWAYLPKERELALKQSSEYSRAASFQTGPSASLERGSKVTVQVSCSGWHVTPEYQTIYWTGSVSSVSFSLSGNGSGGVQTATCRFFHNGLRIAEIPFEIEFAETGSDERHFVFGAPFSKAFASYASKDRARVLARVQGMEKLGIQVFVDVRNLRAGTRYPDALLSQISASDVLYLFWSKHAKASDWVEREWRYGLERRGIDFIDPVPLVDPRKVAPPPELAAEKHFNDWTLAYLAYEKSASVWGRLTGWLSSA